MLRAVFNTWRLRSASFAESEHASSTESLINKQQTDMTATISKRFRNHRFYGAFLPFLLIVLYTLALGVFFYAAYDPGCKTTCDTLMHLPAQGAITYERVTLDSPLGSHSPYVGEPRQEVEAAWHQILKYTNIRLQEDDLRRINRTSIPLNDGKGGVLATLDVFHQLHCLNVLRKQIYRDYYPDRHTMAKQLEHADHCVDILRQVLICHADISVQTYTWIDDYRWPWPKFNTEHECRNWDSLIDWAAEHYVPSLVGPILSHPVLGVSYRSDEKDA